MEALRLESLGAYFHTVTVDFPMGNGIFKSASFDAQFARLEQEELEELSAKIVTGAIPDREVVERVLVGWRGPLDAAGNPLPFSPENRDAVLKLYPTQPTIVREFVRSIEVAKEKN
ncbi:hypothetical protein [Chitinibacter sp. GC72]|uniref:hypothetical protein n=1 Tax=Chitinibacter sp. GC72 TaxID=1526917 RepID=UPI0012FC70CE|nr:hypothetical protein [Chitinibacter sp. GC72]